MTIPLYEDLCESQQEISRLAKLVLMRELSLSARALSLLRHSSHLSLKGSQLRCAAIYVRTRNHDKAEQIAEGFSGLSARR